MAGPALWWLVLLALLAASVLQSALPLGPGLHAALALAVAAAQAGVLLMVFMRLRRRPGLRRVAAAAGFAWLFVLLWLAGTDYLTRTGLPGPGLPSAQEIVP